MRSDDDARNMKTFGRFLHAALVIGALALSSACAGHPSSAPLQAHTLDLTMAGLPYVRDAAGYWYVIDTGSPRTTITPEAAGAAPATRGDQRLPSWVFPLNSGDVAVLVTDRPTAYDQGVLRPFAGVIGVDVLADYTLTLDPRARTLTADPRPSPASASMLSVDGVERLGPGTFCIEDGQCAHFGPSRLVFPVSVEGVATWAALDTGRRRSTLTDALWRRLPRNAKRSVLTLGDLRQARVLAFQLGRGGAGPTVSNSVVSMSDDEAPFAKLQVETGRPIEVLVGQSFLQNFVARVDIAGAAIALTPYDDTHEAAAADEPPTIGALFDVGAGCFAVVGVYAEHDAQRKGLAVGDCVTGVDDGALTFDRAGLTSLSRYFISRGAGATVRLTVRRGPETRTLDVAIEDLLPRL